MFGNAFKFFVPVAAENVAKKYNVSREDQDKLACDSQRKAAEAVQAGSFNDEIVPVTVPGRKPGQETVVDRDLHPKPDTTMEVLAKLRPAFIVRARRNTHLQWKRIIA